VETVTTQSVQPQIQQAAKPAEPVMRERVPVRFPVPDPVAQIGDSVEENRQMGTGRSATTPMESIVTEPVAQVVEHRDIFAPTPPEIARDVTGAPIGRFKREPVRGAEKEALLRYYGVRR